MNLFEKAKRLLEQPTPPPATQDITKTFTLAHHFKGFKALPIVVYGNAESERNNQRMAKKELPGHTIKFIPTKYNGGKKMYLVTIDDMQIGEIYDNDTMKRIDHIQNVYALVEDEKVANSDKIITRSRVRLFVKEA